MQIHIKKVRQGGPSRFENGYVLLGALLMLLLISAVAVTVSYTVTSERSISTSDEEGNLAYYGAEAGMEKMTADLGSLYSTMLSPTQAQVAAVGTTPPNIPGIVYSSGQGYSATCFPAATGPGCLTKPDSIVSGPYAGLQAEIIPINLSVIAQRNTLSAAQVHLTRLVQVGLIPVFQFGVFSDSDLSFFPGPPMEFNGRVHTNGNLFVTADSGNTNPGITFHAKVTAAQDIIITQLSNTLATGKVNGTCYGPTAGCSGTGGGPYEGPVFVPTSSNNGCYNNGVLSINTSCTQLIYGSLQGGPGSNPENAWKGFSQGTTNSMVESKTTGASVLTLPFVQAGVGAIEIIREPMANEDPTTAVGQSRLYNEAQIRVILADKPADLPGGGNQPGDVWLDNIAPSVAGTGTVYTNGITVVHPALTGASPAYFANGNNGIGDSNWTKVTTPGNAHAAPNNNTWPGVGGWLRVETRQSNGSYVNVTQEWLTLGFARGTAEPTHGAPNSIHPDAILILQKITPYTGKISSPLKATDVSGASSTYNWYPINMYDAREGLFGDTAANSPGPPAGTNCPVAGVMSVVELDVRNLQRWLKGNLPVDASGNLVTSVTDTNGNSIKTATGTKVENQTQTGYILYFSDRRGTLPNTGDPSIYENGMHGSFGFPQQQLDVAQDTKIQNFGQANIGKNFGIANSATALLDCSTVGRAYPVSGARHALRVLDGASGDLPGIFDAAGKYVNGGFTVASEQPVYLLGDYNANALAPDQNNAWPSVHVPSSIIADAVTLLSNNWNDDNNMANPNNPQPAAETRYRTAIAAGKNVSFSQPAGAVKDYGTDGGVHNFLRYIENWSNVNFHYRGSMVSFYYSRYGTGVYKSSNVYSPPVRDYTFDTDFSSAATIPPGTPHLLNIANQAYHQDFNPQ